MSHALHSLEVSHLLLSIKAILHHRRVDSAISSLVHYSSLVHHTLRVHCRKLLCLHKLVGISIVLHVLLIRIFQWSVNEGGVSCHHHLVRVHFVGVETIDNRSHGVVIIDWTHTLRHSSIRGPSSISLHILHALVVAKPHWDSTLHHRLLHHNLLCRLWWLRQRGGLFWVNFIGTDWTKSGFMIVFRIVRLVITT